MSNFNIPKNYKSELNLYETQIAIKTVKDFFQTLLAERLHLLRVSAPLFVAPESGLNDNLNGVERPVTFDIKCEDNREAEIVQSLAKWKRYALKKYGFSIGEIYFDRIDSGNGIPRQLKTEKELTAFPGNQFEPVNPLFRLYGQEFIGIEKVVLFNGGNTAIYLNFQFAFNAEIGIYIVIGGIGCIDNKASGFPRTHFQTGISAFLFRECIGVERIPTVASPDDKPVISGIGKKFLLELCKINLCLIDWKIAAVPMMCSDRGGIGHKFCFQRFERTPASRQTDISGKLFEIKFKPGL